MRKADFLMSGAQKTTFKAVRTHTERFRVKNYGGIKKITVFGCKTFDKPRRVVIL